MTRKIYLLLCLAALIISKPSMAQLTVQGGYSATQLVNKLVGSGVKVINPQFYGSYNAAGIFNGKNSNIGLDSGILITSGDIMYAPGPNFSSSSGTDNSYPGDNDLTLLAGVSTYDAAILEFDFVPSNDSIEFKYVFASEEYNEFVCANVNDAFAFFISGPGFGTKKNLALIPGTNIPVSINTLNNGSIGGAGSGGAGCVLAYSSFFVDNTNGATVEYDGFTKVLTARAVVIPNDTFHIRIAIADGGDGVYDSGVFLQAKSFSVTGPPPIPAFQANKDTICAGECIDFTDHSINATSWSWKFPGSITPTSSIENPQSICYLTAGNYNVVQIVGNSTGTDSLTFTKYIYVSTTPTSPTITQPQHGSTLYCSTDPTYTSYQWYDNNTLIPGATDTFLVVTHGGNYNVRVSNVAGCQIAVGITIVLGLDPDLKAYNHTEFSLSPNPATDQLIITNNWKKTESCKLTIYNALGEKIYADKLNSKKETINCQAFPKGIYFVQIDTDHGRWIDRLVKE